MEMKTVNKRIHTGRKSQQWMQEECLMPVKGSIRPVSTEIIVENKIKIKNSIIMKSLTQTKWIKTSSMF
jgi:hypothetical protein